MMNVGDRKGERYIMWCKVRGTYGTGSLLDVIRTYYSLLTINVYILVYTVTYSTFMLYTTIYRVRYVVFTFVITPT